MRASIFGVRTSFHGEPKKESRFQFRGPAAICVVDNIPIT